MESSTPVTVTVWRVFQFAVEKVRGVVELMVPSAVLAKAGVPAHHLAVIAAAVTTVLDRPFRIVRVTAPAHWAAGWAHQGQFESSSNYRVAWDRLGRVTGATRQRRKLW